MATNDHSGYPLKWFKDQNAARHAWECAICLKVLKDPVQVRDCGHQFCSLCIDDILKADPRCPSCRIEISDAMIFEDHAARRLIKQLEVNCCNEGCGWHGHLSALLQEHQSGCNLLIHSGDGAHQLDVRKLEQKLGTLMLKVSTLEKKHEEDIKELKSKHENEMAQVKLQHDTLRQEFLMSRTMGAVHAPHVLQQILPRQEPVLSYTWQIPKNLITKKLTKAKCGIVSDPFISSHGYMMKFGINSNEASSGYAGYMGIYLILMKSDQDGALTWPFNKRFTFVLVDQQDDVGQRKNIKATLVPKGEGAFMKPHEDENEGYGYQNFVQHLTLGTRQYIRNNFARINVLIEP